MYIDLLSLIYLFIITSVHDIRGPELPMNAIAKCKDFIGGEILLFCSHIVFYIIE